MNPSGAAFSRKKPSSALARLDSWAERIGLRYYSFVNVSHDSGHIPAKCDHSIKKHARFDPGDMAFLEDCIRGEYHAVVALGGIPHEALDRLEIEHFRLPHPSGRNRVLNDKSYVYGCLDDLARYIEEQVGRPFE